jgi:hypothetical protein
MLLAAMVLVALPLQAAPLPEVPDGVFTGTLLSANGGSLVVRADSGDVVSLVLDGQSDMPAGFVSGTRVAVHFQALENRRYRAVSVSPPRIPPDANALTTLPPWPEPEAARPTAPREQQGEAPMNPSESRTAPAAEPTFVAATAESAPTRVPSARSGATLAPSSPEPPVVPSTNTVDASPSADEHRAKWLALVLVLLLATTVVLAWRAQSRS